MDKSAWKRRSNRSCRSRKFGTTYLETIAQLDIDKYEMTTVQAFMEAFKTNCFAKLTADFTGRTVIGTGRSEVHLEISVTNANSWSDFKSQRAQDIIRL